MDLAVSSISSSAFQRPTSASCFVCDYHFEIGFQAARLLQLLMPSQQCRFQLRVRRPVSAKRNRLCSRPGGKETGETMQS